MMSLGGVRPSANCTATEKRKSYPATTIAMSPTASAKTWIPAMGRDATVADHLSSIAPNVSIRGDSYRSRRKGRHLLPQGEKGAPHDLLSQASVRAGQPAFFSA
jgi:hypothetical protein